MQYPRKIRNFSSFIDGVGYAGKVTEGSLPELKIKTEAHRGGGMDGSIAQDMGMEGLQAAITLAEWPPELIKMFGTRQRMTFRPASMGEDDFSAEAYVSTMGGRFTVTNFGDLKPGGDTPLKLTLEVDYFRMVLDGDVLFEIDVEAGKRIIGGVDQLAEIRAAMGI
jgi:P2 family phage contractile tail tube protein